MFYRIIVIVATRRRYCDLISFQFSSKKKKSATKHSPPSNNFLCGVVSVYGRVKLFRIIPLNMYNVLPIKVTILILPTYSINLNIP